MTVTRGEVGEDNLGKGGRVSRKMYKGHMEKNQRGVGSRVGSGDAWGGGEE